MTFVRHNFLFKYDDPEIAKWFNNQPQGTKAKALEQAFKHHYRQLWYWQFTKGNCQKAVLLQWATETNADITDVNRTSKLMNRLLSTTKSVGQTKDTANQQLSSGLDNSVDDPAKRYP